jgi:2-phospho-L-lactate guanylyltransferase (CobY/MobA/RfbA family)
MKIQKMFVAIFSIILLSACASQKVAEKKVEIEIKNETVVKRVDVATTARDYITKSNTLSQEQKNSLLALQEKTLSEAKSINEEINKIKMVLIKTLMEPKINQKEIAILKKDLRKLSKKQLETSLSAFEEARKIISPIKDRGDKEFLFNSFMMRQNNAY